MSDETERLAMDAALLAGFRNAMKAGRKDLALEAAAALSPETRDKFIAEAQRLAADREAQS